MDFRNLTFQAIISFSPEQKNDIKKLIYAFELLEADDIFVDINLTKTNLELNFDYRDFPETILTLVQEACDFKVEVKAPELKRSIKLA